MYTLLAIILTNNSKSSTSLNFFGGTVVPFDLSLATIPYFAFDIAVASPHWLHQRLPSSVTVNAFMSLWHCVIILHSEPIASNNLFGDVLRLLNCIVHWCVPVPVDDTHMTNNAFDCEFLLLFREFFCSSLLSAFVSLVTFFVNWSFRHVCAIALY